MPAIRSYVVTRVIKQRVRATSVADAIASTEVAQADSAPRAATATATSVRPLELASIAVEDEGV